MFPTSKLFKEVCPDFPECQLSPCLFSHVPDRPPALPGVRASTSSSSLDSRSPAPTSALKRTASQNEGPQKSIKTTVVSRPAQATIPRQPVASTSPSPSTNPTKRPLSEWDRTVVTAGPPRLGPLGVTHTPSAVRQKMLSTLYAQFTALYSSLADQVAAQKLASEHAVKQEAAIYSRSNKNTYRNSTIQALARLKKRPPATSEEETGTLEQDTERQKAREEAEKGRLTMGRIKRYVSSKDLLAKYDYMIDVPKGKGGEQPTEEGNVRKCDRCSVEFVVHGELEESLKTVCSYHYGRMVTEKLGGIKQRVWSCCPTPEALPCQRGPHVFKDENIDKLHSRVPFVFTSSLNTAKSNSATQFPIVALDCELVYTTSGMALARLTVVSEDGSIVLDEHVRPQGDVLDKNTRFSGVKEDDLAKAVLDIAAVREALGKFVGPETVVVGHGLENDLKALRLVHLTVIDTAIIFTHPRGIPWRHALRNLTRDHLGKFIQDGDPSLGHSAADDARAALDLVRFKMKQDLRRG